MTIVNYETDPITKDNCEANGVDGVVRTFELARRMRDVSLTTTLSEDWRPVATGDFNDDGRVDLVFHDRGQGPTEGQRRLACSEEKRCELE